MVKLNKFLILVEEYSDFFWNVVNLISEDCVVFISYSGCIYYYEWIMIYLKYVGVLILLIIGNQYLEMVKQVDMCFVILQEEYDFVKVVIFFF